MKYWPGRNSYQSLNINDVCTYEPMGHYRLNTKHTQELMKPHRKLHQVTLKH